MSVSVPVSVCVKEGRREKRMVRENVRAEEEVNDPSSFLSGSAHRFNLDVQMLICTMYSVMNLQMLLTRRGRNRRLA